ncbi:MAG: CmpA/NrtA family ABC transporter substrate-binding protein [Roseibium sp.]
MSRELKSVIAGFIPLLDCAVLVVASEMRFAEREGIALKLIRETSWANIRDRIAVGHFDVAHMLAPMPIAMSLNLSGLSVPMLAPMLLGLGGNAITVSTALWEKMKASGASPDGDARSTGAALSQVIKMDQAQSGPFRFAVVHPFSGHAYELRYWMAASGIDPDIDVEIVVLSPQMMADALMSGQIDGYCVGEPWNTAAVTTGNGRIATYKQAIWPDSPEKVLGVTRAWAATNPETLASLMRALAAAADWCACPKNAGQLAELLARREFLDCPAEFFQPALTGKIRFDSGSTLDIPDFLTLSGGTVATPNAVHGQWFYEQMVRWGQVTFHAAHLTEVENIYCNAKYLQALGLTPAPSDKLIRLFDKTLR